MAEENFKPFLKFLVKEGRFVLVRPRLKRKSLTPERDATPSYEAPQAHHERKQDENGNLNVNGCQKENKEHSETCADSILDNESETAANVEGNEHTSASTLATTSATTSGTTSATTSRTSASTSQTTSATTSGTTSAAISASTSGTTSATTSGKKTFKRRTSLQGKTSAVLCPRTKRDDTESVADPSSHGQEVRIQPEEGAGVAQVSEEGLMDCSGKCPSPPLDQCCKISKSGHSGQKRKSAVKRSILHRTGLPEEVGSNICDSILVGMQDMLSSMTRPKSQLNEHGKVFSEPPRNVTMYPKSPASVNIKKSIDHSNEKNSSCDILKTNPLTERDPEVSSNPRRSSSNSVYDAHSSTANSTRESRVKARAHSSPGSHDMKCVKINNKLTMSGLAMSRQHQDNQDVESQVMKLENSKIAGSAVSNRRHTLQDIDTALRDSKNKENILKFDSRQLYEKAEERIAGPDRASRILEVKPSKSSLGRILKFRQRNSSSKKEKRKSAMRLFLHVLFTATEQILPEIKEAQDITQEAFCSLSRLGEVVMPDSVNDQIDFDDGQAASSHQYLPTIPQKSSCSVGNKDIKFLDKAVASKQQKQRLSDEHPLDEHPLGEHPLGEHPLGEQPDEPPGFDPVDSCHQTGTSNVDESQAQELSSDCHILIAEEDGLHFHDHTSPTENSCAEDRRELTDDEQDSMHSPDGCASSNADSSSIPILCDSELASEYFDSNNCDMNDQQPISPYEHDLLCQEDALTMDVACSPRDKNESQSCNDVHTVTRTSSPSVHFPSSQCVGDCEGYDNRPSPLPNRETQSEGISNVATEQLAVYTKKKNYPSPILVDVYAGGRDSQQRDTSVPCLQASIQSLQDAQFPPCIQNCTSGQIIEHFQIESTDNEFVKVEAVKMNFDMLPSSEVDVPVVHDSICLEAEVEEEIGPELTEDEEEHLRQYFDDESCHATVPQVHEEPEELILDASNFIIKTERNDTAEGVLDTGGACRMSLRFTKSIKLEPFSSEMLYGSKDYVTSTIRHCGVSEPESSNDSTDGNSKVKKERTSTSPVAILPSDGHHVHSDAILPSDGHHVPSEVFRVASPCLPSEEEVHLRQFFGGDSAASIVDGQGVMVSEVRRQSTSGIGLESDSQTHIQRQSCGDKSHSLVTFTENVQPGDDGSGMIAGVGIKCENAITSSNSQLLTGGQEPYQTMTENTEDSGEVGISEDIDPGYGNLASAEDTLQSTVMSDTDQQGLIQSPSRSSNELAEDPASADVDSSTSDSDFDLPSYLFPDENTKRQKKFGKRQCKKAEDRDADENRDSTALASVGKLTSENKVLDQLLNSVVVKLEPDVNMYNMDLPHVKTDPIESGKDGLHHGTVLDSQTCDPQSQFGCLHVQQHTDDRLRVQQDREVAGLIQNRSSKEPKIPETAVSSDGKDNNDPRTDMLQKPKAVETGCQKRFRDARSLDKPSHHKSKEMNRAEKCKTTVSSMNNAYQQNKKSSAEENHKEVREMSKSEDKHHRSHTRHRPIVKQHPGIREKKHGEHKSTSLSMTNVESTSSADQSILNACPAPVSETLIAVSLKSPEQGGPVSYSAPNKIDLSSSNEYRIEEADLDERSDNRAQERTHDSATEMCDPPSDDSGTLPTISLTLRNSPKKNNRKILTCFRSVSLDNEGISSNRNSSTSSEQESDASKTIYSTVTDNNSNEHVVNSQPSTVTFPCAVCSRVCESRSALNHHRIIHRAKNYRCSVCDKSFYKQSNLTQHLVVHTGGKSKCPVCGKMLSSSSNMKYHVRMHSGEKPYECNACGMRFSVSSSLRLHSIQHNNLSIKCGVCRKTFQDPKLLKRHMKVHEERKFHCNVCGKAFKRPSHLKGHMKIHTGQKDCKCYVCDASFFEMPQLKQHMLIHTGQKDFQCDVCQKRFSTKQLLGIHLRIHTGQRRYNCGICGKSFSHAGTVSIHMTVHTGARPFRCETCGKAFSQSSHLRTHQWVHKEWTVECNQCDRKFLNQQRLEKHSRTHRSVRPFKCDVCLKRMLTRKGLERHKQKYCRKTLKPFQCNQCDTRFLAIHSLKNHQKRHSQRGEFPCHICHKIFTMMSKLMKHQINFHKFSTCSLCEASFPSSSDLDLHLGEHQTDGGYLCPRCPAVLPEMEEMEEHLQTHRRKTVHCPTCKKHYASKKHLLEHTKRMHPLTETNSGVDCAATEPNTVHSPQNVSSRSGSSVQMFNCDHCNTTFHDGHLLMKHALKHKHSPHKIQSSNTIKDKTSISSTRHSNTSSSSSRHDKTHSSSTRHDETQSSSIHHDETQSSSTHHDKTESSSTRHDKAQSSSTHHNKTQSSSTRHDETQSSSTRHDETQSSSTHHDKTESSSTRHDEAQNSSTHHNKTESSSTCHDKAQNSSTHHDEAQNSSTHHDKTESSSTCHDKAQSSSTCHDKAQSSSTRHDKAQSSSTRHNKTQSSSTRHDKAQSSSTHHDKTQSSIPRHDKTQSSSTRHDKTQSSSTRHDETQSSSTHHDKIASSSTHGHHSKTQSSSTHSSKTPTSSTHHGSPHSKTQSSSTHHNKKLSSSTHHSQAESSSTTDHSPQSKRRSSSTHDHRTNSKHTENRHDSEHCYSNNKHHDHGSNNKHGSKHKDCKGQEDKQHGSNSKHDHDRKQSENKHSRKHDNNSKHHDCRNNDGKHHDNKHHHSKHDDKHDGDVKIRPSIEETKQHGNEKAAALHESSRKEDSASPTKRRKYKCQICDKCFYRPGYLDHHVKIHHSTDVGDAAGCDPENNSSAAHLKEFTCSVCSSEFNSAGHLEHHMKKHAVQALQCWQCQLKFSDQYHLDKHENKHHSEKKKTMFECEVCLKFYKSKASLVKHTFVHTGQMPFQCDKCEKSFTSKSCIRKHQTWHLGLKPHKCDICPKAFPTKIMLENHVRVHSGEKPFPCPVCGKRFSEKSKVPKHMKVHTGWKPFTCDVCDRAFSELSSLKNHSMIHSESRPFTCDVCCKSFKLKLQLEVHTRIHIGDYSFKCDECGKAFVSRPKLHQHEKIHSAEHIHECKTCHKKFKSVANLRCHLMTHNNVKTF